MRVYEVLCLNDQTLRMDHLFISWAHKGSTQFVPVADNESPNQLLESTIRPADSLLRHNFLWWTNKQVFASGFDDSFIL